MQSYCFPRFNYSSQEATRWVFIGQLRSNSARVLWTTINISKARTVCRRLQQKSRFYFAVVKHDYKTVPKHLLTAGKAKLLHSSFSKQKLGLSTSFFFFFCKRLLNANVFGYKASQTDCHEKPHSLPSSCFDKNISSVGGSISLECSLFPLELSVQDLNSHLNCSPL